MTQAHELRDTGLALGSGDQALSTWRISLPLIVGIYVYLLTLYQGSVLNLLLLDGDTYWHVAAGRWILAHQAIPSADPFSHTMPGVPWVAHEWLSEVLLAHEFAGWTGVVALTGLAFATTAALLTRALLSHLAPARALLLAVAAVMMVVPHLLARPHILSMPLLMLWTIGLVRAADAGRAPSLWLLPVMAVWANAHGGFTLGLALTLAFALEAALDGWRRGEMTRALKSWGLFFGLAVCASVLTPQGPNGLVFTWHVMVESQYALSRIGEWASPDFHRFQPLAVWLLGGLAVVLHQGLRLPPVRLLLVLGLIYLSLKHMRNIELLGLLAPLFVAAPLATQWRQAAQLARPDRIARRLGALAPRAGAAAAAFACLMVVPATLLQARLRPVELPMQAVPVRALEAALRAGVQGPVLNAYNWGGYLIYSDIAVFIDGRAEMYGDAFFKTYIDAMSLTQPASFEPLLAKYRITWTLLSPDTPAVALLDRNPNWKRVHTDDTAVVHMRRSHTPEGTP